MNFNKSVLLTITVLALCPQLTLARASAKASRKHHHQSPARGNCYLNMVPLMPYGDNMTKADCRREGLGTWAPYGGAIENTGY